MSGPSKPEAGHGDSGGRGKKKELHGRAANLDDLLHQLEGNHSKSLDEAFKAYDEIVKEEHQNHVFNMLAPAHDKLYAAISEKLDDKFKDDDVKPKDKEKEVKQAVAHGLKEYFKMVQPSITKVIEDLHMDEDEQYGYLTSLYDRHVGADQQGSEAKSIRRIEALAKSGKATIGRIKRDLYNMKDKHIEGALGATIQKQVSHHLAKYTPIDIARYLVPKLQEAGYDIKDKLGYATASVEELLKMRNVLYGDAHPYLEKPKKKEGAGSGGGGHAGH